MVAFKLNKAATNLLYYFLSIKNDSTSFFYLVIFLSYHAFVGGQATGINYLSIFFYMLSVAYIC